MNQSMNFSFDFRLNKTQDSITICALQLLLILEDQHL